MKSVTEGATEIRGYWTHCLKVYKRGKLLR